MKKKRPQAVADAQQEEFDRVTADLDESLDAATFGIQTEDRRFEQIIWKR